MVLIQVNHVAQLFLCVIHYYRTGSQIFDRVRMLKMQQKRFSYNNSNSLQIITINCINVHFLM